MLLELSGLSAHFGKKQVLHQMSLSVGEGEVVALIGPNAAGKSTTMRCVRVEGDQRRIDRFPRSLRGCFGHLQESARRPCVGAGRPPSLHPVQRIGQPDDGGLPPS